MEILFFTNPHTLNRDNPLIQRCTTGYGTGYARSFSIDQVNNEIIRQLTKVIDIALCVSKLK